MNEVEGLRVIGDALRAFSESITSEQALFELIARHVSFATGDACTVRLLSEDRVWLETIASFHPDLAIHEAMREIQQRTSQRAKFGHLAARARGSGHDP